MPSWYHILLAEAREQSLTHSPSHSLNLFGIIVSKSFFGHEVLHNDSIPHQSHVALGASIVHVYRCTSEIHFSLRTTVQRHDGLGAGFGTRGGCGDLEETRNTRAVATFEAGRFS